MTMLEQGWQFQFAQWPWLILPLVLFMGYFLIRWLLRRDIHWRFPEATITINQRYYHPRYSLLKTLSSSHAKEKNYARWLRIVMVWGFIILCSVALAQPEWVRKQLREPEQYRDIVFVVDTSVSMLQRDYLLKGERVDRMTLLKGILARFIDQLSGDNVSIIVYADAVYTLVPLTRDHQLAKAMLARIHTGLAGRSSALGNALAQAVHESQQSTNRQRVLVLFTDATRQTGQIKSSVATEMARQAGLRIYTVAIGARTVEASEKQAAGLIYDPADIQQLEAIAKHTGGKFYWAGDTRTLGHAITDIEKAESQQQSAQIIYVRQPLYYWPLLFALLIFTVTQWLNLRQRVQV